MGKKTETKLKGKSSKPELENGTASYNYSATHVELHIGPAVVQSTQF